MRAAFAAPVLLGIFMLIKKLVAGAALSALVLGSAACTTTQRVAVSQPGDQALTCAQLTTEFNNLETIEADAQRDQGVNTANVAAVLLFWPAAVGNWMNADQARDLVRDRRAHLMTIYNSKNCDG
jgi:hypothetical protein